MTSSSAPGRTGMGLGTALFVLVAVGYFGLEIYAASRNAYRMEPDFIFGQYVEAARAVALCSPEDAQVYPQFRANFGYARGRATELVSATELAAQEQTLSAAVEELIERQGCADIEVFKLRKRYENLARQNLPVQRGAAE